MNRIDGEIGEMLEMQEEAITNVVRRVPYFAYSALMSRIDEFQGTVNAAYLAISELPEHSKCNNVTFEVPKVNVLNDDDYREYKILKYYFTKLQDAPFSNEKMEKLSVMIKEEAKDIKVIWNT